LQKCNSTAPKEPKPFYFVKTSDKTISCDKKSTWNNTATVMSLVLFIHFFRHRKPLRVQWDK